MRRPGATARPSAHGNRGAATPLPAGRQVTPPVVLLPDWKAAGTVHSANLALFANYLAASFPTVIAHSGAMLTDALEQAGMQPPLMHPRTG